MDTLLFYGSYRLGREIHPHVFVGEPIRTPSISRFIRFIPWDADPVDAWVHLRDAEFCEADDAGLWVLLATGNDHPHKIAHPESTSSRSGTFSSPTRALVDHDRLTGGHDRGRDFLSEFQLATSVQTRQESSNRGTNLRSVLIRHRKLVAFCAGALLILGGIVFVMSGPRADGTPLAQVTTEPRTRASQAGENSDKTAQSPSQGGTASLVSASAHAPTASRFVQSALISRSTDPVVSEVRKALQATSKSLFTVYESAQNGDIVLCDVASFSPEGTLNKVSVILVKTGASWSFRSVVTQ